MKYTQKDLFYIENNGSVVLAAFSSCSPHHRIIPRGFESQYG